MDSSIAFGFFFTRSQSFTVTHLPRRERRNDLLSASSDLWNGLFSHEIILKDRNSSDIIHERPTQCTLRRFFSNLERWARDFWISAYDKLPRIFILESRWHCNENVLKRNLLIYFIRKSVVSCRIHMFPCPSMSGCPSA